MPGPAPEADKPIIDPSVFADSEEEAGARFERTRGLDPFPEIPSALLNTADLLDYVAATGMIYPLDLNWGDVSEMLKPASCGIKVGGEVIFWDTNRKGKPKKVTRQLAHGEELKLKQNAIVYVTLEPTLRLPDYMAARFNLTIRDIYRGLLVGTGPLVDPGFQGRLSLPLHNLTVNDYRIYGGEPLVWMEFTKLSPNKLWTGGTSLPRSGQYVEFPQRKLQRRSLQAYLARASDEPITSSIPPLLRGVEKSARNARRSANVVAFVSFVAAVAVVVGVVAALVSIYGLVDSSNSSRDHLTYQVDELEHQIEALRASQTARARVGTTP
jgi:deoxycytidine triphosphate deaminase